MSLSVFSTSLFVLLFIALILTVVYKVWIRKSIPSNVYTPFDYITGQSVHEFQEENKEDEQEEEKEQGDAKDE
ncbi:DUF3951 domain-containing protein [Halobacillus mangrovi]|uniref:DUF3951 domain-containing protein n=1 Tax=Halobacillus mangrovi TaxID=402384 RepID=A0A1W5ZX87_9BACI|nr:DUF3951 domain-containing protein [Halobacillus mangrovi]ARI77861.1 hypothetical protein HM131_13825 [Halobacillus mangrovi]